MAHIGCRDYRCTSKLPEKALSFMGTKWWRSHEAAQSFFRISSLFITKTRMLSLFYSLVSSSGSPKSSSNLHITLSEFSLETIFAQSATRF